MDRAKEGCFCATHPLDYWPPKAFNGSSKVLRILLSDFASEVAWEDLVLGVDILTWLLEKISSKEGNKKEILMRSDY